MPKISGHYLRTAENHGTLTRCHSSLAQVLPKDIVTLPGVGTADQVSKEQKLPQARQSGQGDGERRERDEFSRHPCSASSHCWGTGRPCVAANLNLICVFCLDAGPQPRSVHSLSQLSLTVLCTPKMAEKKSATTNLYINIAGVEKNPHHNKLTGKYAHD